MYKGPYDYFKGGDFNAVCDICSFKYKGSMMKKRWDGFMCCDRCWESRQSQDFVRGVVDNMTPPWTRPNQGDEFVDDVDPADFNSSIT